MNKFSFMLLVSCLLTCCVEDISIPEVHSGYVVIGCNVGPYYLNIDSLKANCGAMEALATQLKKSRLDSIERGTLMISNVCAYDETPSKLGTQTNHDIKLERPQVLNAIELSSSFSSSPISMTLDSTVLSDPATDYPLLGAYEVDLNPGTFTVYVINIWVGGCLHDMIIWETVDG